MKAHRRYLYQTIESLVELSDDQDELLELLSHSHSLIAVAENIARLRRLEAELIKARLKKLRGEQQHIRVSDHAVVRYLERVVGLDVEACRQEMISKMPADYKFTDDISYVPIESKGLQYIVRDGLVVTVTPVGEKVDDAVTGLAATIRKPSEIRKSAQESTNER